MNRLSMNRLRTIVALPAVKWALAAALVGFLALLPLLAIEIPGVFPGPSYTPGTLQLLAFSMLIAALALSYHLIFGVAGLLSFGHALYFAIGAYGLGIALRQFGMELLPAMVLVFVVGLIVAAAVGALSLRVTGISFAMVTLAFAQAGSVLIRKNPGQLTGGDEGLTLDTTNVPDFLVGVLQTQNLYWLCLAVLVLVFLVTSWFERSRAGHVVAATRENELRVRVIGIRPYFVTLLTFVIGGVLATVVGMAYLLLQSNATQKLVSADFTLTLLVIVVLGGVGYRWGAVNRWCRVHAARPTIARIRVLGCCQRPSGHSPDSVIATAFYSRNALHSGCLVSTGWSCRRSQQAHRQKDCTP